MLRHSSRRQRLDSTVLAQRLAGAVAYDRIAGYFRSSLFEVAGEALAQVQGPVRIICNSDLDPQDLITAAAAQAALRRSWSVTRGKALAILLALIAFVVVSLVALGLPVALLFAATDAAEGGSGAGTVLAIIGGLLIIPVLIAYTLFASAFTASLHSEVTGGGSDRLEEVFA